MKLRLPSKLVAAIMAAASPVLFTTIGSATFGETAAATETTTLGNVMYIGDSITNGHGGMVSWRWQFFKMLTDNGISQTEQGINTGRHNNAYHTQLFTNQTYGGQLFENVHSGYSSGRAWEISGRRSDGSRYDGTNIKNWLGVSNTNNWGQTYNGTVYSAENGNAIDNFFLLIGTNDLLSDAGYSETQFNNKYNNLLGYNAETDTLTHAETADIEVIYNTMKAQAPSAGIVMLTIPTTGTNSGNVCSPETVSGIMKYNELLTRWVADKNAAGGNIKLIDVNKGLIDVTDSVPTSTAGANGALVHQSGVAAFFNDGLHPSAQGELIIAGNVAKGMGIGGRTAGLERSAATADGWSHAEQTEYALGGSTLTFAENAFTTANGYTVDFGAVFGNGAEEGWLASSNALTVTIGDGSHTGTLNMSEGYIMWGSNILYSQDNHANTDKIRIAYHNGSVAENVAGGYYVWLGDMLIGEGLTATTGSGLLNGITLGATGAAGTVSNLSWANTAYAPTTTGTYNSSTAFLAATADSTNNTPLGIKTDVVWTATISENNTSTIGSAVTGSAHSGNVAQKYSDVAGVSNGVIGVWGQTLTGDLYMEVDSTGTFGKWTGGAGSDLNSASIAGTYNGAVTGSVTLVLNSGNYTSSIYGGSHTGNNSIDKGTNVYVNGGSIAGSVFGGGRTGSISEGSAVTVTGGVIEGSVYGGGTGGTINGGTSVHITGGVIRGSVYGGMSNETAGAYTGDVTIESNHASIAGSINANNVTLKDIADGNYTSGTDRYHGAINATTKLTLDGYTAAHLNAAITTQGVLLTNNSQTTISNLTLTACDITAEAGSSLTLEGNLTLGNTATYSGDIRIADGITISMSSAAFAAAEVSDTFYSAGVSGFRTLGSAVLTSSDTSRLKSAASGAALTSANALTFVGADGLAGVTFFYNAETGTLSAGNADGTTYYVNDKVVYNTDTPAYAASDFVINDGGNLQLDTNLKSGVTIAGADGSTSSKITVDNGVTLAKSSVSGTIATYVVNDGGTYSYGNYSNSSDTSPLDFSTSLTGAGTMQVKFTGAGHGGAWVVTGADFSGTLDLSGKVHLQNLNTNTANAAVKYYIHDADIWWSSGDVTVAHNITFGGNVQYRPQGNTIFSGILTDDGSDNFNWRLGQGANSSQQNKNITLTNAGAASLSKVTLENDNLILQQTASGADRSKLFTGNVFIQNGHLLTLTPKDTAQYIVKESAALFDGKISFADANTDNKVYFSDGSVYIADGIHFADGANGTLRTHEQKNQFINGLYGHNATLSLTRDNSSPSNAGYFNLIAAGDFSGTLNLANNSSANNAGLLVIGASDALANTQVQFANSGNNAILAFLAQRTDGTYSSNGQLTGGTFADASILGLGGVKGNVYADTLTINLKGGDYTYSGGMNIGSLVVNGTGTQQIGASTIAGDVIVNGGTLKLGSPTALGAANGSTSRNIIINEGGTIDINGQSAGTDYAYTLAGGKLVNNGGATGAGNIQTVKLTLTKDSAVGGTGEFHLISSQYGPTSVVLNDHTLTKEGTNTLHLKSTAVSSGTLRVTGGVLDFQTGTRGSTVDADIVIARDATADTQGTVSGTFDLAGGHTITSEVADGIVSAAITTQGATTLATTGEGSTLSLTGGLTLGGTLYNTGNLVLNDNAVTVNKTKLWEYEVKETESGSSYSGTGLYAGSGYLKDATLYLVKNTGSVTGSLGTITGVDGVDKDENGNVTFTTTDTTTYYVNSNLDYNTDEMGTVTNLHIADGVTLTASANPASAKKLIGSGTYSTTAEGSSSKISVGTADSWTGVVELDGVNLWSSGHTNLNNLANANSWVKLTGATSIDNNWGSNGTITANLILEDKGANPAWLINEGTSTSGYNYKYTFTGDIKGSGTLKKAGNANYNEDFIFQGDVSGWTGKLDYARRSQNGAPYVKFEGKATTVNAAIVRNYNDSNAPFSVQLGTPTNGATEYQLNNSLNIDTLTATGQNVVLGRTPVLGANDAAPTFTVTGAATAQKLTVAENMAATIGSVSVGTLALEDNARLTLTNSGSQPIYDHEVGAITLGEGAVLDLTALNTVKESNYNNNLFNLMRYATGAGTIKTKVDWTFLPEDAITTQTNFDLTGNLYLSIPQQAGGRSLTIGSGTTTTVSGDARTEGNATMVVQGVLTAGRVVMGHESANSGAGFFDVDGGSVVTDNVAAGTGANNSALTLRNGGTLQITGDRMFGSGHVATIALNVENGKLIADGNSWELNHNASVGNATFETVGNQAITVSGVLSDADGAHGTVTKTGEGALTLSGANTFTGGVTIENGALIATSSSALNSSAVTFADLTSAQAAHRVLAFATGASYDSATGTLTGTPVDGTIAGLSGYRGTVVADTLTIDVAEGGDYRFLNRYSNGTTNDGAVLSVNKLVKQGAGTQVIGGEYTTGSGLVIANGVDVQGGTLHLKTRGIVTANFDVQAGATLKTTDDAANKPSKDEAVKYNGSITLHGTADNVAKLVYTDGSTYTTGGITVDGYGEVDIQWAKQHHVQSLTGNNATLILDRRRGETAGQQGDPGYGGYLHVYEKSAEGFSGTIKLINRTTGNEDGGLVLHNDIGSALADTVMDFTGEGDSTNSLLAFLTGDATYNDHTKLTNTTFADGSVAGLVGNKGVVKAGALTISTAAGGDYTYGGTLSITDLVKSGAGTQSLNVTSSMNTLDVQGGILKVTGGALTVANGVTIGSGASLHLTDYGSGSSRLRGSVTVNNGGTLLITKHDSTGYNGGANALQQITVNQGGQLLLGFTDATSTANQNETFTGTLILNGTLDREDGLTLDYKPRFDLFRNSGKQYSGKIVVSENENGLITDKVRLHLRSENQNAPELSVGSNATLTVNAVVEGEASLTKTGSGTLLLNADNTYTGGTTISEGTVKMGHNNALGTNSVTVANAGTLDINGHAVSNAISLAGTITNTGSSQYGLHSGPANVTLTDDAKIAGMNGISVKDATIAMGSHTLSVTNNEGLYFNNTTVTGGGTISADGTNTKIVFYGAAHAEDTKVNLSGNNNALFVRTSSEIGGLSGSGKVQMDNGVAADTTLTINVGESKEYTSGATLVNNTSDKSINIAKTGAGTQEFIGNVNSFNGTIEVNNGTLAFTELSAKDATENINNLHVGTATVNDNGSLKAGRATLTAKEAPMARTVSKTGTVSDAVFAANSLSGVKDETHNGGSITNGLLAIQEAATYTISDMTLTNSEIRAAETQLEMSNINVDANSSVVALNGSTLAGNNRLTLSDTGEVHPKANLQSAQLSGLTLQSDASLAITLDNTIGADLTNGAGFTITLSGFQWEALVNPSAEPAFTLESLNETFTVTAMVNGNQVNFDVINAQMIDATGSAPVALKLTVVPEPTTGVLSLLALAGMAARRRRK